MQLNLLQERGALLTVLLLTACLCLPDAARAQFFEGFAKGFEAAQQRKHEREMLELQLQALTPPAPTVSSTASGLQGFDLYREVDFFGADLSPDGIRGIGLEVCVQLCRADNRCVAATWVEGKAWCFLKGTGFEKVLRSGVISAQRQ